MPAAGRALSITDVEEILTAVKTRKANFPNEPEDITWALVLMNIGARYTSVACIEGEWIGKKRDIPKPADGRPPSCPNGHPLIEATNGITIGWVATTT